VESRWKGVETDGLDGAAFDAILCIAGGLNARRTVGSVWIACCYRAALRCGRGHSLSQECPLGPLVEGYSRPRRQGPAQRRLPQAAPS